ncbi:lipoamide acyltransferase component of branched-chain alpha-keto acid dehydrogenase complex, mitochondrial isoform X2 [Anabrus simplex]|uniref:lipoamide acyltransferase component of branched-chain alpha-keto acid dehydrogenase complex, mitochondrial isoform X2 n=1 Tax=Anabrus simplex TaxID=316456 RepID=UPI0035A31DC4
MWTINMAGYIKFISRVGHKVSTLNAKRISKLSRNLSSFSKYAQLHQNTPYISNVKKISSMNYGKRSFSQAVKVVPFNLSDIGEGIKEVTIKEWFVKVGDKVSQFDNICEVQSDKASVTITSRYDGIITKLHYDIDEIAEVGKPLVDLQISEDYAESPPAPVDDAEPVQSQENTKVLATPAVRRIAAEHEINLNTISGTGRNGRVLKEDLLAYLGLLEKDSSVKECSRSAPKPEGNIPSDRTEKIKGVMKIMTRTMTAANMIPHLVYSDEIVVDELVSYCSKVKQLSNEVKVTYMPFFIKAASKALEKFPILNSSVDEACENITYKSHHNIGVSMDTPSGLLVPNIKNVQQMDIVEIAKELNRLHKLALEGALTPSDLAGGTFTLSNIGSIGGTYTKPVLLPPEVAIGGIGKIQVVPRYNQNDDLVKTRIICISWAADHRVIDGATVARFSNTWKYYVENPILTMLRL